MPETPISTDPTGQITQTLRPGYFERNNPLSALRWAAKEGDQGQLVVREMVVTSGMAKRLLELLDDGPRQVAIDIGGPGVFAPMASTGKRFGLQVLAVDRVIAWVGDLEAATAKRLWSTMEPAPALLHDCRGLDAMQQAAKWLQEQIL